MEFKYTIFDTHSHYDDEAFDGDRDEVLKQINEAGVIGILNCACSKKSLVTTNELTLKYIYKNNSHLYFAQNFRIIDYIY